ncbi:hypothetical protein ACHAWT_000904 [Skeletonema menzelii]
MVGFGSSLRMSRRRGWEDAYLDYASLRLLLTQIEAVYEEEDWKARDSAAAANNGGGYNNTNNVYLEEGYEEDVGQEEDEGEVIANNNGYYFLPSVVQSAWEKTRSVVTGQPIPTRRTNAATTSSSTIGGGHRYNKRRRKQRSILSREYQDSEYFEYSSTNRRAAAASGGGGNRFHDARGRLLRRNHRRRNHNSSTNSHHRQHHHAKSTNSRGKESDNDDDDVRMIRGDDTNEEEDDYYDDDDRALDKSGWRIPGVLDYRDELFLESDEDLAFGYYDEEEEEEEDNDDTEEDEEDGEWVDVVGEEGDENNVYRYDHDDTIERGEGGGGGENYHPTDGLFEENHHHHMDIIIENNSDSVMGDDNRLILERPSSEDDDSNIRAELDIAAAASGETISPDNHHHHRDVIDSSIINTSNDGMRTPKSRNRHSFSSDPNNNNNNNNLLETPERTLRFTESPGVLEAGYETFAVAAARRGDMGGAKEHAMYVGSPAQQGWFDFIPNLWGDNTKQKQRGESRPLLFHDNDEAGEDHRHDENRGGGQHSPGGNLANREESSLGDSTHRYTSLRSKTSPTPFLPARRLSKTSEERDQQNDDIESKFTFGPSAFVDREASASFSPPPTKYRTSPVMATAIGSSMPMTPTSPPTPPAYSRKKFVDENIEKGIVGFGVPIQMIPTEAVELLRPSSPRKSPTQSNFGSSRFYSFQNDNDNDGDDDNASVGSHTRNDVGGEYNESNMISFYSGGGSLRSSPNNKRYSYRQQHHHHHTATSQKMKGMPSLSSNAPSQYQFLSENPIMNLLLGRSVAEWDHGGRSAIKTAKKKKKKIKMSNHRGLHTSSHKSAAPNALPSSYPRSSAKQSRAAAAAKSKRARLRRERLLRRQRREERIPHHLRAAHVRAAAITERFRGLLRAEVEKVILFANSRLGELSDTIGCLRYSSYEDGQDDRKAHPHLADGGIHQLSSSDEEDGGGHHASDASSSSDGEAQNLDITIEQDAATRRQIMMRDRMRMMRPLFQKADFLGEDFSLLSAVDEADAYAAVGVELMHLLKFVCVNIIAVRKICKKHDRLLSNRMLGGYYKRLAAEAKKSQNQGGYHHQFHWNEHQFGGTLSNRADSSSTGGYIYGIYDTKIQHIANSTTMQTVSSSLSIALADFEASQSRSARLGLGFEPTKEFVVGSQELPTPRHKTASKSRGVLSYQLGGHCFRGDDDSSIASQERDDDNESASSNISLTRLQFVVTSIFGLREAARIKLEPFEQYASRLFMTSTGPNVVGDGLDGCSRETLDLLCSYNPDAAYTLDSETLFASLKIGRENEGVGGVMVASLAAATKGSAVISNSIRYRRKVSAALCIKPQLAGADDSPQSSSQAKNRNILSLNTASMVLFLVNYYCVVPVAHIHSTQLGSVSSSALLIGAANITAILSSSVHALVASKRKSFTKKHLDVSFFRTPLMLSALFPLIGNILYSLSVKKKSLEMALIGRLLVGLGSAEVLNRRLVSTVLPNESVNAEVASLVKKSMLAVTAGLLIGALVDVQVRKNYGQNLYGVNSVMVDAMTMSTSDAQNTTIPSIVDTSNATLVSNATTNTSVADPFSSPGTSTSSPLIPEIGSQQQFLPFYPLNPSLMPFGYHRLLSLESVGIIMACLWFFQLVMLSFFFDAPGQKEEVVRRFENSNKLDPALEEDFDSDSVGSENAKVSNRHASKPSFDSTGTNPFASEGLLEQEEIGTHGTFEKLQVMSRKTVKNQYKGSYLESIACVRRLAMSNIAFPTTLSLLFLAKAVNEVLLSSCASIMYRYFWCSGAKSGLFMGVMTCCILPINLSFSSEKNFTERSIIKNALVVSRYGLILMVNYEALFYTIKNAILRSANQDHSLSYDGFLGTIQYILSFAVVFFSICSLESVTLSLMSKVSPIPLRKYSLDSSFAVIFVSSLGRIAGDVLVWVSDLSSWIFFYNIVNMLCFCLIICLLVGSYVVKKHYFFLV